MRPPRIFIFIILIPHGFFKILKFRVYFKFVFLIFYFKLRTDFLKFTFKISIFGFKISCLF